MPQRELRALLRDQRERAADEAERARRRPPPPRCQFCRFWEQDCKCFHADNLRFGTFQAANEFYKEAGTLFKR